jgi:hypothetical protein
MADDVFAKFIGIGGIQLDHDYLYLGEYRPDGRTVFLQRSQDGYIKNITHSAYNARTRVHEYGGGDYFVADEVVYFSNFSDQCLYRQTPGFEPQPLTKVEGRRYADAVMDRQRKRLIAIREDHTTNTPQPGSGLIL